MKKTIIKISLCLFLISSCNSKKSKNNIGGQIDNDAIYDSLSVILIESTHECDSLRMNFEQEVTGTNGFQGYGPNAKYLDASVRKCESINQRLKVKLDSIFNLTSKEFKTKHYKQNLIELDTIINKNKNTLIYSKKFFESEIKSGGAGLEATKLKKDILYLEKQIHIATIAKDSINILLRKLK
jgi:hypothetical protein